MINHHHIILDGWSFALICDELWSLYEKFICNRNLEPIIRPKFKVFIEYITNNNNSVYINKFKEYFSNYESPSILGTKTESNIDIKDSHQTLDFILSELDTSFLYDFAQKNSVSANNVFQTIWALLVSFYSNSNNATFGITVSGRVPEIKEIDKITGLLINTLPLCFYIDYKKKFKEFLREVADQSNNIMSCASMSLSDISKALDVKLPLFDTLLVYENYPENEIKFSEIDIATIAEQEKNEIPLSVLVIPKKRLNIKYAFDKSKFEQSTIERMHRSFCRIIEQISVFEDISLKDIDFLHPCDQNEIIYEFNNTEKEYKDANQTVSSLFEKIANKYPHLEALKFNEKTFTYAELDEITNRIANYLRINHPQKKIIGVFGTRSEYMSIALIAILKSGAAYLPLDPDNPDERLLQYLLDANCSFIIFVDSYNSRLAKFEGITFNLCKKINEMESYQHNKVDVNISPIDPAYVLFTSGSTGKPKGVVIQHRVLTNRILWMQDVYRLDSSDSVLQKTPFGFDVSVWEFFWPLITGATLIMSNPNAHKFPEELKKIIDSDKITTLHFVPSMLEAFLDYIQIGDCKSLRKVFVSGEALSFSLQSRFFEKLDCELHNLYGPTECTIDVTYWNCKNLIGERVVPIGKPISNIRCYVLDRNNNLLPPNVKGELFIGGVGLAKEYINNEIQTIERFPIINITNYLEERVYKTGDEASFMSDGNIRYHGRLDFQVKIHGFRIELEEIENAVESCSEVKKCIVDVKNAANSKKIVAYVIFEDKKNLSTEYFTTIKEKISNKIPSYMIPNHFVSIDDVPTTKNGKIDKDALPIFAHENNNEQAESWSEQENKVAKIWSDLLGCHFSSIRKDSNFFFIGGDSILSIQLANRLCREGLKASTKDINRYPVFATLVEHIIHDKHDKRESTDAYIKKEYFRLSPIQQWFFNNYSDNNLNIFCQYICFDLNGVLSIEKLKKSVEKTIKTHDTFSLRFLETKNDWQQKYVEGNKNNFKIIFEETSDIDIESKILELSKSINIFYGPLIIVYIAKVKNYEYKFIFLAHHLLIDSVSWSIIIEDIFFLYKNGEKAILPKSSATFYDWISAIKTFSNSKLQNEIHYWNSLYDEKRSLPYLENRNNPKNIEIEINIKDVNFISNEMWNPIFLTVFSKSLSKIYNQEEILIDIEGHGREDVIGIDSSRIVGWFTSKYPFVLKLNKTIEETFLYISSLLKILPHNGIGFGILKYFCNASIKENVTPIISFNFLGNIGNSKVEGINIKNTKISSVIGEDFLSNYVLDANIALSGNNILLSLAYDELNLSQNQIKCFIEGFKHYLKETLVRVRSPLFIADKIKGGYCTTQGELEVIKDSISNYVSIDNVISIWPLTPFQEGILFHSYDNDFSRYKIFWEISFDKSITYKSVNDRLAQMFEIYDIFRVGLVFKDVSKPLQYISKSVEFDLEEIELMDSDNFLEEIENIKQNLLFDLNIASYPLSRFVFVKSNDKNILLCAIHHIIIDGWSAALLLNKLFQLNKECSRPLLQFSDFMKLHFIGLNESVSKEYWTDLLEGTAVPLRLMQPNFLNTNEKEFALEEGFISSDIVKNIIEKLKESQVDIASYSYSIFSIVLNIFSMENDLVFGTVFSGRSNNQIDLDSIVGPLANSLPLRIKIKNENLLDFTRKTGEQIRNTQNYEQTPLRKICEYAKIKSVTDLFDILFVFQNYPRSAETNYEMKSTITSHYGLTFIFERENDVFLLKIRYKTDSYSEDLIRNFLNTFIKLFKTAFKNFSQKISDLVIIDGEYNNKNNFVYEKNEFDRLEYYFDETAKRYPDLIAIEEENNQITYKDLQRNADDLSIKLMGVFPEKEKIVGVAIKTSIDLVTTTIALLKAKKTICYLDSLLPSERVMDIVLDSGIKTIITSNNNEKIINHIDEENIQIITIDDIKNSVLKPQRQSLNETAFICYTSGSSGKPKGVVLSHVSAINRLLWLKESFPLSNQNYALKSSLMFAPGHREIFEPLIQGKKLIIFPETILKDSLAFMEYINQKSIGKIFITPSFLEILLEYPNEVSTFLENVKLIELSGEPYMAHGVEKLRNLLPNTKIFNRYGCTEAASVVYGNITNRELNSSLKVLGTPIRNTSIYILDQFNRKLPNGVLGEICISSESISNGYLNNEKETQEKFIDNLFGNNDRKLYKTGDIGLLGENCELMYWGRKDFQIKIRGYRVELKEIERVLSEMPLVKGAAVLFNSFLIAFVHTKTNIGTKSILNQLRNKLPAYMIPEKIVFVDGIPLLKNGKINYQQLKYSLEKNTENNKQDVTLEPKIKSEIEKSLYQIWSELFPGKEFEENTDFFDIGGNSLILMKCSFLIEKKLAITCPIHELIKLRTIRDLSEFLKRKIGKTDKSKAASIFFFPPAGGGTHHYEVLKNYLNENIKLEVLYIEGDNIFSKRNNKLSIPEQADKYISILENQYQVSQIILGGWSLGGTIAYEVARKLKEKGINIEKLILIDSGVTLDDQLTFSNNGKDFRDTFEYEYKKSLLNSGLCNNEIEMILENLKRDTLILDDYRPKNYDGNVVLIKPTYISEKERNYNLEFNGWNFFVTGDIKKYEVQGDHTSMMTISSKEIAVIINNELENA